MMFWDMRMFFVPLWQACFLQLVSVCMLSPTVKSNNSSLSVCETRLDAVGGNVLDCTLQQGYLLDFGEIRKWSGSSKDAKYSVQIRCHVGGIVYLPWPFQARNVVSLTVEGCKIEGFLSEMTVVHAFANELKTLVLTAVSIILPLSDMIKLNTNLQNVPWETDCGPLNLERLELRDIKYDLKVSPEERDGIRPNKMIPEDNHHKLGKACVFTNLKYIDESGSRKAGRYHLQLLPEYSIFPKLEVYNMSSNDLRRVPDEFRQLHSKKFPILKHVDFSNNKLSRFEFDFPNDLKKCSIKVLDLRQNQITSLPIKIVKTIQRFGTLFIDLRDNPLKCNCRLAAFKHYLESQYRTITDKEHRKMISSITCNKRSFQPGKLNKVRLLNSKLGTSCAR